jgi:hypothetical protein
VQRHPQGLADGEESDGHDHDVDAVGEFEHAEGEALLPGELVQADQADGEADQEGGEAADAGAAEDRGDGDEGQHHDGEVVGGADVHRPVGDGGGEHHQQRGADHAAREVADGGRGQGLGAAPGAGHGVALEGGDDRGGLAGGVEEDGGGGAAEHAAVVDAGEHDERGGGLQAVGDGQQQGDRHGRADAGQHADGRAEQHAQRRPQQVGRGEGRAEALDEGVEGIHGYSTSMSGPPGSGMPSRMSKTT